MTIFIRVLAALPALLFLVMGIQWLFAPAEAAAGLEMPLLQGAALLGHAPFAVDFILAEAIMTTILLVAARRLGQPAAAAA